MTLEVEQQDSSRSAVLSLVQVCLRSGKSAMLDSNLELMRSGGHLCTHAEGGSSPPSSPCICCGPYVTQSLLWTTCV